MRLAPGREVIPIGTVGPNGVFRLGLLDELGSPVCDLRQWADFGVRGSVGKDEVCWHQERRLNLDTVPLSGVRPCLSSGNCHTEFSTFSTCVPALGGTTRALPARPTILSSSGTFRHVGILSAAA